MKVLRSILNDLMVGSIEEVTKLENRVYLNELVTGVVNGSITDLEICKLISQICYICYSNIDTGWSPVENGFWDAFMKKYKQLDPEHYQYGAPRVELPSMTDKSTGPTTTGPVVPFEFVSQETKDLVKGSVFGEVKTPLSVYSPNYAFEKYGLSGDTGRLTKRIRNTSHTDLTQVGTLSKAKFVTINDARIAGAEASNNAEILERDFFGRLIREGKIDPQGSYNMIVSVKYDGVSVEARIENGVITKAVSRGDMQNDMATDWTPLLQGYCFPRGVGYNANVKFEAIIIDSDLIKINRILGKNYCNGRSAISGLLSNSRAREFVKFITLVPISAIFDDNPNLNRLDEIAMMNSLYATRIPFYYQVLVPGDYTILLYGIREYVNIMHQLQSTAYFDFMYDGIVCEFTDTEVRRRLGRTNFVNNFAYAVKFEAEEALTVLTGVYVTVGKTGIITPKGVYIPVNFFGSTHKDASLHSYARFKDLNLAVGDIIRVTYNNQVMAYINKVECPENNMNHMKREPIEFPKVCPECGQPLKFFDKTVYCVNNECPGRDYGRLEDTLAFLGFKDIAEESVKKLGKRHIREICEMSYDEMRRCIGEAKGTTLFNQIENFKVRGVPAWYVIGALGFSNIAQGTFKKIFAGITLTELCELMRDPLRFHEAHDRLQKIRDIGPSTVNTIFMEWPKFDADIQYIMENVNLISGAMPKVVFTGVRDADLARKLMDAGYDSRPTNTVTRFEPCILIISDGLTPEKSSKLRKAIEYGYRVIPYSEVENELLKKR